MYSPVKKLTTQTEYSFPYEPYAIQQQLMEEVYTILAEKCIGIFESPTGTGKSLTLTCAALRWLEDRESLERSDIEVQIKNVNEEIRRANADAAVSKDWINANYAVTQQRDQLAELRRLHQLLQSHDEKLNSIRERQTELKNKRQIQRSLKPTEHKIEGADKLLNDESIWEETSGVIDMDTEEDPTSKEESYRSIQIFFCSRTHSQLTQVVREVKRTAYGRRIRCISLASRQQLCINPQVRKLPNVSLMNERCLDMARKADKDLKRINKSNKKDASSSSLQCCTFRKASSVQQLSDAAVTNILDVEDLVKEGESLAACPYYASREALQSAQLVMLTYQMLLHRRTRQQTGIDLRGSIIIIDEAHNLLDTISQLYSCEVTLQQLVSLQQQIIAYKTRYIGRFSTNSLLRINQLLFVIKRLIKMLQSSLSNQQATSAYSRVLLTYELCGEGEFNNIDLFALLKFCEESRLAQKLQGFTTHNQYSEVKENVPNESNELSSTKQLLQQIESTKKKDKERKKTTEVAANTEPVLDRVTQTVGAPIRPLLSFIEALTENCSDGRVFLHIDASGDTTRTMYKYMLLNPGGHFADIIRDARAIIIAGGTMQPTTELTEQLFRSCMSRVKEHFYDHVVSANAVLPLIVSQGPTGRRLCFNFAQRGSIEMLTELGMILQNVCSVVPAGIVCFLPSYEYLDIVYKHLQRSDIHSRISRNKRIFCEPRTATSGISVDELLSDYAATIKSKEKNGAILFSVVGGKLSEGLNFSDDLGRCVIVVGMPYPNRHSPELQERMKYLDSMLGTGAGNDYYENLCMKAVNQCIGRSVRHINDYASVLLLDERYNRECILKKLPKWITRGILTPATFGAVQVATARFFKQRLLKEH